MDLTTFCAEPTDRPMFAKPFSFGEYTYATDGRLAVRISRVPTIGVHDETGAMCEALFAKVQPCEFKAAPTIKFPHRAKSSEDGKCEKCDGSGLLHKCPSCQCRCRDCEGTGKEAIWHEVSFELKGVHFAGRYLFLLKDLPGLKFGVPSAAEPLRFSFDGGDGLLMPKRGGSRRNVKLTSTVNS